VGSREGERGRGRGRERERERLPITKLGNNKNPCGYEIKQGKNWRNF
jgi:hypothetical protein